MMTSAKYNLEPIQVLFAPTPAVLKPSGVVWRETARGRYLYVEVGKIGHATLTVPRVLCTETMKYFSST